MATQVSLNSGAVASAGALAIQTNGTTQAVSISTGQVATLAQNPILTSGTANGVAYLNGSKVLTTGSALTFDGTTLGLISSGLNTQNATSDVVNPITASTNQIRMGASGFVSFRLGTAYDFNIDSYNSASPINLYNITQDGTHKWSVSGSEQMRLTSTSLYTASTINVGIGTSSPLGKLQVKGANPQIFMEDSAGGTNGKFTAIGTSNGNMTFNRYLDNGTLFGQLVTLDSSGNLLVGTTSTTNTSGGLILRQNGNEVDLNASGSTGSISIRGTASTGAALIDFYPVSSNPASSPFYSGRIFYSFADNYLSFATNGSERARIDSAGIVTMSAYGAGAATFSAAGVISSVSDETWKIKDGVPVDPDSMLKKLEPGYWYYNEEKAPTFGADRQLGFYAQNVNAAIGPEAAPTPEEGKPWGYYDRSVLAVTVMSLQKALATIETLTARITALESA